jgi:hypothetical protein
LQSKGQARSALARRSPIHDLHLPKIGGDEMNKSQVSALLASNPFAVTKAIVLLFSFQTVGERNTSSTVEDNKVGFSAAHAKDASYWARWVLRVGPRTPAHIVADRVRHYLTGDNYRTYRTLSGQYLDRAREVAAVYWRQLDRAAKAKAQAQNVPF